MAKLSIVAGSTSQSANVFIQNSSSTTGAGLTGLVYNTSGLTAYYSFAGANATSVAISLVTLAAVTTAYSSGGFKEIDSTNMPGIYRLDLPTAVLAASKGRSVVVYLQGAANMAPCVLEIELTGWDNQNATTGGIGALPATACTTNGSLLTAGTGTAQINTTSGVVSANATQFAGQTITCAGGVTVPAAILASTTNITAGTIANLTNAPTAGDLTAAMKTSVTTAATAATPTAAAVTGAVGSVTGAVGSVTGAVGSVTGAVGSVTGNVGGSVASVTAAVTVSGDFSATMKTSIGTAVAASAVASVTGTVGGIAGTIQTLDALATHGDATWPTATGFAPASTALSSATWTGARAGYIDNLAGGAVALETEAVLIYSAVVALGSPQQTGSAVTLPANPPAGFLVAASYGTAPVWYTAPDNTNITAIKVVTDQLATALELNSGSYRFTVAALAEAPGGGSAPTTAEIVAAIDSGSTQLAAIRGQTDSLSFSVPNVLDANVAYVNGVPIQGTGAAGAEWGPA